MNRFIQWLNKIPVKFFVLVYIILSIALPLLFLSLNIENKSIAALIVIIPGMLYFALLAIRFLIYLKETGSDSYYYLRFFFGYMLICIPAGLFIVLDSQLSLNGFLIIPGYALEAGLLIWLYIRHLMKQWRKEHSVREETSSSYSFEKLCDDLSAGREIEFTYDNCRYLFIPENGRYYFKRIVSIDPYGYEVLAEAGNALVCIDASSINGIKISGLWPDVEDITVY